MKTELMVSMALLFVVSGSAVVGGPEPKDGELAITSGGSSASSTTAVGPNGTAYSSKVEMSGRESNISIGNTVENITYSENETTFDGYIQAPTPCHVIDQETTEVGDSSYSMNIQTIKENESQQCVQQAVMIKYSASFEADTPNTLEVMHNNQTVKTLQNVDKSRPDPRPPVQRDQGIVSSIINGIKDLLGIGPKTEKVHLEGEDDVKLDKTGEDTFKVETE